MHQCFLQRLVRVLILDILAHDADRDRVLGVVHAMNNVFPLREVALFGLHVQALQYQRIHVFMREHHWHLVD